MKKQIIISVTGLLADVAAEREWAALAPKEARAALPHYFVGRDGEVWKSKEPEEPTEWLGEQDESRVHVALCNVGPLRRRGGRFCTEEGDEVKRFYEFCTQSPYRGHVYYELIAPKQLAALERLCRELFAELGIRYRYDATVGGLSPRCQGGGEGVWLASGLKSRRIDPHPQTELVAMLRSLGGQPRAAD